MNAHYGLISRFALGTTGLGFILRGPYWGALVILMGIAVVLAGRLNDAVASTVRQIALTLIVISVGAYVLMTHYQSLREPKARPPLPPSAAVPRGPTQTLAHRRSVAHVTARPNPSQAKSGAPSPGLDETPIRFQENFRLGPLATGNVVSYNVVPPCVTLARIDGSRNTVTHNLVVDTTAYMQARMSRVR